MGSLAFATEASAQQTGPNAPIADTSPDTTVADEPVSTGTFNDEIVVTARVANAGINGIAIEPLRLPQNVRILDSGLIDDLGAVRLDDLLDLSGSVSRQNNFGNLWDNYAIRGFAGDINGGPDLLINRFNANRGFNAARDVATIELFQVLKGPASALSGKGEPGGSINIVTKAPRSRFHAGGELEAGSFGHYRAALDFGGPVNDLLSVRLIGVREDNDSFRDFVENDRVLLAPSVSLRPSDSLSLLYQLEYSVVNSVFDRGVVALETVPDSGVLNGRALPRDRFLGEPGDGDVELRSVQHQGSFTADIAPGVTLEGGAAYRDGSLAGTASEVTSVVGTSARRRRQFRGYGFDDLSGRIELAARGDLFGLRHQFRVGGDAYRYDIDTIVTRATTRPGGAPYAIDVFSPVYSAVLPTPTLLTDSREEQRGEGMYAQDLIEIGDLFTVLLGIRHDRVRQRVVNNRTGLVTTQSPSVTSPRAALTFKPVEQLSIYAGYGKSFRFNQGIDVANDAFAPERGEAYEAGIKYALLNGRVNGTVSAFSIEKANILTSDPANAGFSIAIGRARSRGVEADINARLGRFDVTAVYALIDTEVLSDRNAGPAQAIPAGTQLSNVPKHSGSLFAQWKSNEDEPGSIAARAGITYVGDREGTPTGVPARGRVFRLPSYVTVRAGLGYTFTSALSAHVDVENILDEYYLASSFNENWITPGTPRTVRARLQVGF